MAFPSTKSTTLFFFFILTIFSIAKSSDPDPIVDFFSSPLGAIINGSSFTFTGLRSAFTDFPPNFKPTKATFSEFPALLGQSVSMAILQYPAGTINPPHTHPRSAELLLVVSGSLQVGFIDTTNQFFNQTLQVGDLFVFPKGLVHFQFNADPGNSATAIAAFASANPGTVSLPPTVFTSGISDEVLAEAFKTDVAVIRSIKVGLTPPKS
ncbi:putative germin-like protein 9-2 [Benincasa hispida]|uniref:putative germin-like protein 9-2 n=1 Tax=Benincasa hispida TaxID=102211 RepID=UPI0018FF7027|nr:putative germin-like protein 9-2 [Benincasa hispida]